MEKDTIVYSREHPALEEDREKDVQLCNADSPDSLAAPIATDEDIFFAKERYKLHLITPKEGVKTDILKHFFSKKYGF